ncbi:UNVERIFIED_CONTAM: hypothetical protein K2H54_006147 [Gekko kuhli]
MGLASMETGGFSCQIGKSSTSTVAGVEAEEALSDAEHFDEEGPTSDADLRRRGGIDVSMPSNVECGTISLKRKKIRKEKQIQSLVREKYFFTDQQKQGVNNAAVSI